MRQSIHWRVRKMYRWTNWGTWPVSPHVKESKTVLDSGFHAVDSWSRSDTEFWIINFLPVELRFRIPVVSGIPDSLGCIPGSPTSKNFPDSGIRISLQGHTASGNQCSAFLNTPIRLQIISLWHDVKFIDPHWDSSRVKEAIRIRSLYPNNINRDDRIVDACLRLFDSTVQPIATMKRRAAKGTVSYTNNTSKASDRITHQAWLSEVHSPPLTRTHSVTYSPTRQIDTIAGERPAARDQWQSRTKGLSRD